MKLKSYICTLLAGMACIGLFGSCEDMLEPDSKYVIYDDGNGHLNSQADKATSLVGIIYQLAAIGDRTNLLGEVRGDLVSLTSAAHSDLLELASFEVSDENRYNNPRDYYAIINNCNYYIANADENLKDVSGQSIFAEEIAQVRAIRAWTYLQLVLNYGKVPFYDQPILTEQDAALVGTELGDRWDLEAICDYFIEDLTPYVMTRFPQLNVVGSINMSQCAFPVYVVLGDLYLWKASLTGNRSYYREAAKCYFNWIADTRDGDKSRYVFFFNDTATTEIYTTSVGNTFFSNLPTTRTGSSPLYVRNVTIIPMDSAAAQGYFSEVRTLYSNINSENIAGDNASRPVSVVPSAHMREICEEQSYYFLTTTKDNPGEHVEVSVPNNSGERGTNGDLRFGGWCYSETVNTSVGGQAGTMLKQLMYRQDSRNIAVYRQMDIWLRFAEAMNGAGFPRAAYAVLATGLDLDIMEDSIIPYCKDESDVNFLLNDLNTSANRLSYYKVRPGYLQHVSGTDNADKGNTMGIHARGCGYPEYDPDYAYPMADTAVVAYRDLEKKYVDEYRTSLKDETDEDGELLYPTEELLEAAAIRFGRLDAMREWSAMNLDAEKCRVDSMILNEMALECCYDGKRFYDLIRFAKRYRNADYVAVPVSRRGGRDNVDGVMYSKLRDENNWYLSWRQGIGMK